MSTKIIHETILKDIVDVLDGVKDLSGDVTKGFIGGKNQFTSLTRNANNLILTFPVLCTKGISVETASMISKAIEKYCVTLLQLLLNSVQFSDKETVEDYISQFHTNITVGDKITSKDFFSFLDAIDAQIDEGAIKITDNEMYSLFKEGMSEINNVAKVALNEKSLMDLQFYNNSGTQYIQEAIRDVSGITPRNKYRSSREENNARADSRFNEYITNSDLKKANELMPTKVLVNFTKVEDGVPVPFRNGVIGVKCKLYTVDSMEIVERIASKYADSNWVREFIRASTGEISFLRDFVFALDRAKIDAINTNRKGSVAKMFKVLERRALKFRLSKWKANKADCSPITTLVISQDELEYLKKEYDINLENRNIAIKLMDSYNFMGLVIVDEPAESASFIWDNGNESSYDTLSFRSLERESDDKNYRKVINLMTKISR